MANMISIFNDGSPIRDYRCADGTLVTLEDNQCKDVTEAVGLELLKEYVFLKETARFYTDESNGVQSSQEEVSAKVESLVVQVPQDNAPDFLKDLQAADTFVCSVCSEKFKSHQAMRIHMGKTHK